MKNHLTNTLVPKRYKSLARFVNDQLIANRPAPLWYVVKAKKYINNYNENEKLISAV